MKKTRIITYIKQLDQKSYSGSIIIPLTPITLSTYFMNKYKELLHELLGTKKKIVIKKELEILERISSSINDVELTRTFHIIIDNEKMKISSSTSTEESLEQYANDLKTFIKDTKRSGKITHFIFDYHFAFKD